uniref:Major facilitator superfamily (MFS) profile domain-containing protein n=1 Tax=Megaselia scalaris TaxID=36166 RepID=T1H126_MEGSC
VSSYGRQFVFYFAVIVVTIGRVISIVLTSSFFWFAFGIAIAGIAVNSVFTSPFIISMEISSDEDRTNIAMLQSLGWSISTTILPLLFWWLRDWIPFMWITTIPTICILVFYKNNFDLTEEKLAQLYSNVEQEKVYGMASLFCTWRMAKNTIIMGFS